MSVKKETSGRRSVQVEVEMPGTPEEVWQAIATGPGISSWFVPAAFEARDGERLAGLLEQHVVGTTVGIAREHLARECLAREAARPPAAKPAGRRGKAGPAEPPRHGH